MNSRKRGRGSEDSGKSNDELAAIEALISLCEQHNANGISVLPIIHHHDSSSSQQDSALGKFPSKVTRDYILQNDARKIYDAIYKVEIDNINKSRALSDRRKVSNERLTTALELNKKVAEQLSKFSHDLPYVVVKLICYFYNRKVEAKNQVLSHIKEFLKTPEKGNDYLAIIALLTNCVKHMAIRDRPNFYNFFIKEYLSMPVTLREKFKMVADQCQIREGGSHKINVTEPPIDLEKMGWFVFTGSEQERMAYAQVVTAYMKVAYSSNSFKERLLFTVKPGETPRLKPYDGAGGDKRATYVMKANAYEEEVLIWYYSYGTGKVLNKYIESLRDAVDLVGREMDSNAENSLTHEADMASDMSIEERVDQNAVMSNAANQNKRSEVTPIKFLASFGGGLFHAGVTQNNSDKGKEPIVGVGEITPASLSTVSKLK